MAYYVKTVYVFMEAEDEEDVSWKIEDIMRKTEQPFFPGIEEEISKEDFEEAERF